MDALKKAEKQMEIEIHKWIKLNHCAMAIALKRYHGFGAKRIDKVEKSIESVWEEVADDINVSMLQLCEDETGIEIRNHEDGRSWKELAFLNASIDMGRMSRPQVIYMRQRQATWMRQQTLASILVGIHRECGYGFDRLVRLVNEMNEIIDAEFGQSVPDLLDAARIEANFKPEETRMLA